MDFQQVYKNRQERVNTVLLEKLPPIHQEPQNLHNAMHYAVLNGGKRIRPFLVYATGELFGASLTDLDSPACAIELIHSYSLVHDDLPSMDNDDLRRGKPTCHKAFDEATAILVGDALQSLAFQVLVDEKNSHDSEIKLAMLNEVSHACGSLGLVGGQALDLFATGKQIHMSELDRIHHLKTGTLIAASVKLGLLSAKVTDQAIQQQLQHYAHNIGLCFQIKDDILDIEGKTSVIGKEQGSDIQLAKATYVTVHSLETAKQKLEEFHYDALQAIASFGKQAKLLHSLADYIICRDY